MASDSTAFVRRACTVAPLSMRSRLAGAMHRLEDLLGLPTEPADCDLITCMQRDLIVIRWAAKAIQQLDRDSVIDPGCLDLSSVLCAAVVLQGYVEGELLMPALRDAGAPASQLSEATVLHNGLSTSLSRLRGAQPSDPLFVARTRMLARLARRHTEYLAGTLFPLGRGLVDKPTLLALGNRYATLRASLYTDSVGAGRRYGDARHGDTHARWAH